MERDDKVLIVGGTDFIGRRLARFCLERTIHLSCLSLNERDWLKESEEAHKIIRADIRDREILKRHLSGQRFNYILTSPVTSIMCLTLTVAGK